MHADPALRGEIIDEPPQNVRLVAAGGRPDGHMSAVLFRIAADSVVVDQKRADQRRKIIGKLGKKARLCRAHRLFG